MAAESRPPVLCFSGNEVRLVVVCRRNHRTKQMAINTELKTIIEMKICCKAGLLLPMTGLPDGESADLLLDMVKVIYFERRRCGERENNMVWLELLCTGFPSFVFLISIRHSPTDFSCVLSFFSVVVSLKNSFFDEIWLNTENILMRVNYLLIRYSWYFLLKNLIILVK